MNTFSRPIVYYLCACAWTLVLWEFLRKWFDTPFSHMIWSDVLAHLAFVFYVGCFVGVAGMAMTECLYQVLWMLRGRKPSRKENSN